MKTRRSVFLQGLATQFPRAVDTETALRPSAGLPNTGQDNTICVVGPVVDDIYLIPVPDQPEAAKIACTTRKCWGGGARHVSRAILDYGGKPKPYFLIGSDRASDEAMEALGDEFPRAAFDRCYVELRQSFIVPRETGKEKPYTTRPRINRDHAPEPRARP